MDLITFRDEHETDVSIDTAKLIKRKTLLIIIVQRLTNSQTLVL